MILVPVVGARPIKHVYSRLILRMSHSRRLDRHVFQVTSSLQSWMPSLLSSEASVLITDSSRCVVAMSFSQLRSLSVSTPVDTQRVVFVLVSHVPEHLSGLFTSQSRDEVWVSSPSALNLHVPVFSLVRPETSCVMKSGSVLIHSHFVWQTMFESGDFARQMTVITVVMSSLTSCVSSSGQRLLEYFGGLALFHGRGKVACVLRMFLGWFHRSSSLCIPLTADDECSRDVLRVAKSDGCCVCRCVLE